MLDLLLLAAGVARSAIFCCIPLDILERLVACWESLALKISSSSSVRLLASLRNTSMALYWQDASAAPTLIFNNGRTVSHDNK